MGLQEIKQSADDPYDDSMNPYLVVAILLLLAFILTAILDFMM